MKNHEATSSFKKKYFSFSQKISGGYMLLKLWHKEKTSYTDSMRKHYSVRKLVTRTQSSKCSILSDRKNLGNVRTVFLFKIACEKFEP